jgi:phosphoglycerate dehydrogenase-like enzyme
MAVSSMGIKLKHKVVFTTDRGEWHQQTALASAPQNLDITMLRVPKKTTLIASLQDAEFLISERFGVIDVEIIQNTSHLKLIQRLGSLVHDIDLNAAAQAGIAVCYKPVGGVIRVAEHLIMQLLAITKKLREVEAIALAASPEWGVSHRTDEDTFAYNWSERKLAKRLKGWGCTVLYNKRSRLPERVETDIGLAYVTQGELFSRSDYLVNLLPFVPGTDMLLNASVFEQMKPRAYFVSCGSGSTIDEAALAEAVRSGKLAGAALDTFEYEPILADNPLIAAAKEGYNILLTPHTAAGTVDHDGGTPNRAGDYVNITNYLAGRPLEHQVV